MDLTDEFERRAGRSVDRRTVLAGTAAVGLTALAGCLGGEDGSGDSATDPVAVDADRECDNCSMLIGDYPGPTGQSFYEDAGALLDGEDRPAQFCSSRCTYAFTFEHESEQEPTASYLTDYSAVDYEVETAGDAPTIEKFRSAESFAPVEDLTLVVGSEVRGAMGKSMIGFSDDDDAASFQDEWGGDRYEHEEVNRELVQSLMG
jgi:nitrous oxide reductase accessory protein NosL